MFAVKNPRMKQYEKQDTNDLAIDSIRSSISAKYPKLNLRLSETTLCAGSVTE